MSERTVDFILVYNQNLNQSNLQKVEYLLDELRNEGFDIETTSSQIANGLMFVQISGSDLLLFYFAELLDLILTYKRRQFKTPSVISFKFMETPLYYLEKSVVELKKMSLTNAERSFIIYRVLLRSYFGPSYRDVGIQKLLDQGILLAAYPLHETGTSYTEDDSKLNDRQLLAKYWARYKYWYKVMPLNLLEKYFGPEVAYYFAWMDYIAHMLGPVSLLGFLSVCLFTIFIADENVERQEVCSSDKIICPICHEKNCKFSKLQASCYYAILSYLFDNINSLIFAIFMIIWGNIKLDFFLKVIRFIPILGIIIFILWQRRVKLLSIKWNMGSVKFERFTRPYYEEKTSYRRISRISGKPEAYIPRHIKCMRYTLSCTSVLLMIFLVIIITISIVVYRKSSLFSLHQRSKSKFIENDLVMLQSVYGALISSVLILIFEKLYTKLALWLTHFENPRTQTGFDTSYIYKSFALSFANNYTVLFYIAFIKGRFYTYPGDQKIFRKFGGILSDTCDPNGCIVDLTIQMSVFFTLKVLLGIVEEFLWPLIWNFMKKHQTKTDLNCPIWEQEYFLQEMRPRYFIDQFMNSIISFGFVIFFIACFPLNPLFAFVYITIVGRNGAVQLLYNYRRPVKQQIGALKAWNTILEAMLYISIATNALMIAIPSQFIQRQLYLNMTAYMHSRLSVFAIKDFKVEFIEAPVNHTNCYYPGFRYPPSSKYKYQLNKIYWYEFTVKAVTVIIFEYATLLVVGIIWYAFPVIPLSIRQFIHAEVCREERKLDLTYVQEIEESETMKQLLQSESNTNITS